MSEAARHARRRAEASLRPAGPGWWQGFGAHVVPYLRDGIGARRLATAGVHAAALGRARRLAIVVVPPALPATDAFLDHHRRLGVDHFLCLDGGGGCPEAGDVSVVPVAAADGPTLLGAVNAAARRWGVGRWVLFLLPHEFLVYPFMETRSLADVVQHLSDDRRRVAHAVTVDMYGRRAAGDLATRRVVERHFDAAGYVQFAGLEGGVEIRGGPLLRAHHADRPERAPVLQRIVLVAWRPHFRFTRFRRLGRPRLINRAHRAGEVSLSAALLRYGALARDGSPPCRIADGGGFEDDYGRLAAEDGVPAWYEESLATEFRESGRLIEAGLMSAGRWF